MLHTVNAPVFFMPGLLRFVQYVRYPDLCDRVYDLLPSGEQSREATRLAHRQEAHNCKQGDPMMIGGEFHKGCHDLFSIFPIL